MSQPDPDLHQLVLDLHQLALDLEGKARPWPLGVLDRAKAEGVRLALERVGRDLGPLPEDCVMD